MYVYIHKQRDGDTMDVPVCVGVAFVEFLCAVVYTGCVVFATPSAAFYFLHYINDYSVQPTKRPSICFLMLAYPMILIRVCELLSMIYMLN